MRYRVEAGMQERYPDDWATPERVERLEYEISVIEALDFPSYFLILAQIMQFCRDEDIVYGPGRGSVGGCYVAYALHIHEVDSLQWGLLFSRFLTADRAVMPDVDLDVSQRHRQRVLTYIRKEFGKDGTVVLQVAAFGRAGARTVVDMVAAARSSEDPHAFQIAESLKKRLPANTTGGVKAEDGEFHFMFPDEGSRKAESEFGQTPDTELSDELVRLRQEAIDYGWWDDIWALDGIQTNLAKHAAGVVLLSETDLERLPRCGAENTESHEWNTLTGYDMYSLEDLDYLKYDILGLRTLDLLSDADKYIGGSGSTDSLMKTWAATINPPDEATIDLFQKADTLGVFQVETAGFRHTLKQFVPEDFNHIVQLNALYRPGAIDAKRASDGKNMVDVFIARKNNRESMEDAGLPMRVKEILTETQGIILYQEQSMQIASELAEFNGTEADQLRKAIGKKKQAIMDELRERFIKRIVANGHMSEREAESLYTNIEAAARYSWNKSHSLEYGVLTWLCGWFKANHPEAFYTAYINSWSEKMEKQSEGLAEARQRCKIMPPDVNIAEGEYTIEDGAIVFGLNGIKGMGAANRDAIVLERVICGPYRNFEDFHKRLPSVPINMKLSLIRCGAFDRTDSREWLLAEINRGPDKNGEDRWWTVAEFIKHNSRLKKPRPLPSIFDLRIPSKQQLAEWELETIGFYVSNDPMADVTEALARIDNTIHWGGTIETVTRKRDKRGEEMATATILTNGLTKLRLTVFASVFPRCELLLKKGQRVIIRGRPDPGERILVDGIFEPGDYRHFQKIRRTKYGEPVHFEKFDGDMATVERLERDGWLVELL